MASERQRAPLQGDERGREGGKPPGTIAWSEHMEIWEAYSRRWPGQSAERIAERGGFGHEEVRYLLGREAVTFVPSEGSDIAAAATLDTEARRGE